MGRLPLEGMRILLMEDEALIAMDVEQMCRDNGASDVVIMRNVAQAATLHDQQFSGAIVDLMLGGTPTIDVARSLAARNVPFIFATGYTETEAAFGEFPGVAVIGKPYADEELVSALARAIAASNGPA